MASEVSLRSRTTLSLEQRAENAKRILKRETTPSEALKAAKQLLGSYAHIRPEQPETFLASIAAVLAQYPSGVVLECVDPRIGLARSTEFLSVAKVVEWCETRELYHRHLATYQPRQIDQANKYPTDRVFSDEERELARRFLGNLTEELAERLTKKTRKAMQQTYAPLTDDELRALYGKRHDEPEKPIEF
jgi:hypothetical protein